MEISAIRAAQMTQPNNAVTGQVAKGDELKAKPPASKELREAFDSFVGESFYGQLLGAMRKTQGKPAYFYGGHAEEVFRGQLDQTLATKMAEANGGELSDSLFELFTLTRS